MQRLTALVQQTEEVEQRLADLKSMVEGCKPQEFHLEGAKFCRDEIATRMEALRESCDALEKIVPEKVWPMPDYSKLLFSVE